MRALDLLLLAALAVGGLAGAVALARAARAARTRERAVWEAYHRGRGGRTEVGVRRLGDVRVVTTLADDDPDYDDRFREAMWAARQRAAALQLEG